MHDIPYMNRSVGPEIISSMTLISHEVKNIAKTIPCGIQILSGCNQEALAVAKVKFFFNFRLVVLFIFLMFFRKRKL